MSHKTHLSETVCNDFSLYVFIYYLRKSKRSACMNNVYNKAYSYVIIGKLLNLIRAEMMKLQPYILNT